MTQNTSGHNITKGTAGRSEKVDGDGQTRDADNDEGYGRTQGVNKMDTKAKLCLTSL